MSVVSLILHNPFLVMAQISEKDAGEINVTQSMIDLLSNIAGTSNEDSSDIANNEINNSTISSDPKIKDPNLLYADSQTVLLSDVSLPSGDIMFIYESSPFMVSDGHLTASLPCDEDSITNVNLLIGNIPNLRTVPLESIPELSSPGAVCSYQFSFLNNTNSISHIAIQNNSTDEIELPSSSTITIAVSKSLSKSE